MKFVWYALLAMIAAITTPTLAAEVVWESRATGFQSLGSLAPSIPEHSNSTSDRAVPMAERFYSRQLTGGWD
jgi:hypothetical protein